MNPYRRNARPEKGRPPLRVLFFYHLRQAFFSPDTFVLMAILLLAATGALFKAFQLLTP